MIASNCGVRDFLGLMGSQSVLLGIRGDEISGIFTQVFLLENFLKL